MNSRSANRLQPLEYQAAMRANGSATEAIPLRYVARAGLLPELTRQTYDSLYKAIREVVLNSVDAGATEVVIDVSDVGSRRVAELRDDGSGMSLDDLQQSFMSLGGSQKFEQQDKFGRIGIGSLALMHYAASVEIETKVAGSRHVTRAVLSHPWTLSQAQRGESLADFVAGRAWQEAADSPVDSHYTVVRLVDVGDLFVNECTDVSSFYRLLDRLRRVLPLPWRGGTLADQIAAVAPETAVLIRDHCAEFCADVSVCSQWAASERLTKRLYGDGGSQEEAWNGKPYVFARDVRVDTHGSQRVVRIAGYLLSQVRPTPTWNGLTARVQNVAVEEHTFFDLESDPGFRKYITGEVWLLGDIDRARLVNIDRASFNRETTDYEAVARVMQQEIVRFKSDYVQAPQRAKVAIKRRLDQQVRLVETVARLADAAAALGSKPRRALPSSGNGRIRAPRPRALVEDLQELGAVVVVASADGKLGGRPFRLTIAPDAARVLAEVRDDIATPLINFGARTYALRLVEGGASEPPLIIKNRPHEIVLNLGHEVFAGELRPAAVEMAVALELAYVLGPATADALYDRVLALLAQ